MLIFINNSKLIEKTHILSSESNKKELPTKENHIWVLLIEFLRKKGRLDLDLHNFGDDATLFFSRKMYCNRDDFFSVRRTSPNETHHYLIFRLLNLRSVHNQINCVELSVQVSGCGFVAN